MGHYDECRDVYCGVCGQTYGNCMHTQPPRREYITNEIKEEIVMPSEPIQPMTRAEAHKSYCDYLHDTYISKNRDYGDSGKKVYDQYGAVSYLTRMRDKMNRLDSLLFDKNESLVKDESVFDTCLDLANYALMLALEVCSGT